MKTRSTYNSTFKSLWGTFLESMELFPVDLLIELRDRLISIIEQKTPQTIPDQTILHNFDANGSPVGDQDA